MKLSHLVALGAAVLAILVVFGVLTLNYGVLIGIFGLGIARNYHLTTVNKKLDLQIIELQNEVDYRMGLNTTLKTKVNELELKITSQSLNAAVKQSNPALALSKPKKTKVKKDETI